MDYRKRRTTLLSVTLAILFFAAPASALRFIEVTFSPTTTDPSSLAHSYHALTLADVSGLSVLGEPDCALGISGGCDLEFGDGAKFVTIGAGPIEALFSVAPDDIGRPFSGDAISLLGASGLGFGGVTLGFSSRHIAFDLSPEVRVWGGRSASPVPEPTAALVFAVGIGLVGARVRRTS